MSYNRVNWENSPSTRTPITAENLNKMDSAISRIDGDLTDAQNTLTETVSRVDALEDEIGTASNVFGGEFEYLEEYNVIEVLNENITTRMIEDGVVLMIIAKQDYAISSNAKIRINDAVLLQTSQLNVVKYVAKGDVLIISFTDNKYNYGLSSVGLSDVRSEIFSKSVLSATFGARDKDSTTTELYLHIADYTPAPGTIIAHHGNIDAINLHGRIELYIYYDSSFKYIGVRELGPREVAKSDVLPIVLFDTDEGLSFNYADNWVSDALRGKVGNEDFIKLGAEVQNKANRTELNEYMQKIYNSTSVPAELTDSDNGIFKNIKIYGMCEQTQPATAQSPQQIHSVVNPAITITTPNLYDPNWLSSQAGLDGRYGVKATLGADGSIILNGTATRKIIVQYWFDQTLTNCYLTMNAEELLNKYSIYIYNTKTKDILYDDGMYFQYKNQNNLQFTIESGLSFNNVKVWVMINEGSVAQPYQPYINNITTLTGVTLNAIPVSTGGNVTIDEQQYLADVVDAENGVIERLIKTITSDDYAYSIVNDPSHFLLNAPTTEPLPESIAQKLKWMMYSYAPITKISATSSDVTNFKCDAEYPVDLKKYIDSKMGNVETRIRQYDMDLSTPSEIAVWAVSAEKKG